MYVSSSFANCYHSVNGISSGLAQSDLIKRPLLYHLNSLRGVNMFQCVTIRIATCEEFILESKTFSAAFVQNHSTKSLSSTIT